MKLKEYLKQQNVRPKDITKVLITFKLAAYATWVCLVPICGKFQPVRRFFRLSGPRNLKERLIKRYPERYASWEQHFITGAEWVAKRPTIKWIPETFGQKHKDFGLSIAEATLLYKILFPLWAPLEFMYIVRLYKKKWQISDIMPVPLSTQQYTDLLDQSSNIDVFSLDNQVNGNGNNGNNNNNNHNNHNNNDDDNNKNNKNNNNGNGGGATSNRHKNNNNVTKMTIHTFSSSLSYLIPLYMKQIHEKKQNEINKWYHQIRTIQNGMDNIAYYFQMISFLTRSK